MKKIILIITLIFTTSLFAQYNLVFNKVVNEQLGNGQTELTVPEGKVWKIQGFQHNGTGNTNSPYPYPFSITKPDGTYLSYTMHYSTDFSNQNIWASEGEKISMAGSLPNGANLIAVNALEFNLSSFTSSGGGSGDSGSGGSGSGDSGSGSSSGVAFNNNAGVPDDDFTDPNGNTYGTTNINGMVWTTSNYEGTTYSDGTPIPYISSWDEWITATTGAYTYWLQDESLGYGKLYNLHAIRGRHDDNPDTPNKQFAPDGWHVPSYQEMHYISILYSPTSSINSYSLKSTTGWISGTNGTNISGLDIKPYGAISQFYDANRGFSSISGISQTDLSSLIGGYTYIWTSTPISGDPLRANNMLYLTYDYQGEGSGYSYTSFLPGPIQNNGGNNFGAYVRLVKDY